MHNDKSGESKICYTNVTPESFKGISTSFIRSSHQPPATSHTQTHSAPWYKLTVHHGTLNSDPN